MPFPNSQRVVYSRNPLEQVIIQIRFPPILRIETNIPDAFQESIRQHYPYFEEKNETLIDASNIPRKLQEQFPGELLRLFNPSEKKIYNFTSIDENWVIALTRDFLALTSKNYTRWEEFKNHFEIPFEALIDEYSPALFSRVGLRYQNVICRSSLGLDNRPWSELIQPYIAGPLAAPEFDEKSIVNTTNQVEIKLNDGLGTVNIRHGFAVNQSSDEVCYVIDTDFFAEKIKESSDVNDRIDRFHRRAGRLFRWCIKPLLHDAMEPHEPS